MNIVVVGASGYAGRHIVDQAHRRGHRVRAVVRDKARAESAGAWGAPSLTNMVDEWAVGDVTDRSWAAGVCDGADPVAAGASGGEPERVLLGYELYSTDGTPRPRVSAAAAGTGEPHSWGGCCRILP